MIKNSIRQFLGITSLIPLSLLATKAFAADFNVDNAPGIDLSLDGVKNLVNGLACWFVDIALTLMVVAVVFYGVKFLIAQGDPGKIGDARKGLGWAVVGIVVILGAYTIIQSIGSFVTQSAYHFDLLSC